MKSVILAAGSGTRFRDQGVSVPKPLILLGGLTLLERTVYSSAKAGISEFIIVAGDHKDQIQRALSSRFRTFNVEWVHNQEWKSGNGTTLLAAEPYLKKEELFLVLMCDHLLFSRTLSGLIKRSLEEKAGVMAIDKKLGSISDISDATKVRLSGKHISDVGKDLKPFDAIDIGAAVVTPLIFPALRENRGACLHREGMKRLAKKNLLYHHDIGGDVWEDVDDPKALKGAENILYNSLRKPTDGFLSRHLERRLSLSLTRLLAKTSLKPNHITFSIVLLGALAATLFAKPSPPYQAAGSLLFWFSSFLDGCDGEIARLKFMETRLGGWLDLWSDNLIHAMVFGGIGIGLYRGTGEAQWIFLGGTAILGVFLSVSWISWTVLKNKERDGPLFVSVAEDAEEKRAGPVTTALIRISNMLSRRDFIFWLIFITLFKWLPLFLWMAAAGSILYFLTLVFIHNRTGRSHA